MSDKKVKKVAKVAKKAAPAKRVRVVWTRPAADKLPPLAPKDAKISTHVLAYRIWLKANGKLNGKALVEAVEKTGASLKVGSASAYCYDFTRNINLPRYR